MTIYGGKIAGGLRVRGPGGALHLMPFFYYCSHRDSKMSVNRGDLQTLINSETLPTFTFGIQNDCRIILQQFLQVLISLTLSPYFSLLLVLFLFMQDHLCKW